MVSSGFSESGSRRNFLEEKLLELKRAYGVRIIGPNCLGVMRPSIRLNATFANRMAAPGRIAFISQSGSVCASVLDWAARANVGFSSVVSIGSMVDVDFADLIDYFGADPETRSVLLFIEFIREPKRFMSAARRFAATKPIIVVKAGKTPEGMKAASLHTSAVIGENMIYQAFFDRAGVVRVDEVSDLFNCAEILAMQAPPRGPNLAIITNAGGPGVTATDALVAKGGGLARLSDETIRELDSVLPYYWSHSNPIDICEDATVDRFRKVLETCLKDPNIDGYLVIFSPIGSADSTETAKLVVEVSKEIDKPILTSWLGEDNVREARDILRQNRIPTYSTPEQAVATFVYMYQHARNLELLYQTPEELPINIAPNRKRLQRIINKAIKEKRQTLTGQEAREFLENYGILTFRTQAVKTAKEAAEIASEIGFPVVMKICFADTAYGAVESNLMMNLTSEQQVEKCFLELVDLAKRHLPPSKIEGVIVQPVLSGGYELIVKSKRDPQFGSLIFFGIGKAGVELYNDVAVGFPPLNQTLARRMIEQTKAYKSLWEKFGGNQSMSMRHIEETLVKFSHLVTDFPQIVEADVSPLFFNGKNMVALNANIVLDLKKAPKRTQPYGHLIIRPYPTRYTSRLSLRTGEEIVLRPIRPEDEPLLFELFETFSPQTVQLRFFQLVKDVSHHTLARYCNIDYDREMTLVAEKSERGRLLLIGMAKLVVEPDGESGEIAIVVGDPWQNRGLGSMLVDNLIKISKDMGLKRIFGEILAGNEKMIHICYTKGFQIRKIDEETCLATLDLSKA
ncbi:GNAT family N-acetyltransferase [Candidatus Bathyarchaeota archaeon]|nr:GNAT family N-acetyltransferase [Candidatus Bathyarchaeota archaeon]